LLSILLVGLNPFEWDQSDLTRNLMREENCIRVCSPLPLDNPQTSSDVATSVLVSQSSFESCGSSSFYRNDLDHCFNNEEDNDSNNYQVSLGVVLSKLPEFQGPDYELADTNSLDEFNETVISLLGSSVLSCQPRGETCFPKIG
jgi:hypothetical protein